MTRDEAHAMITDEMVEAGAEVAYFRNREGSIAWAELSTQHKSEWREKVRPVITAANAVAWRPIEDAPHETNVLLAYWDELLGNWRMEAGMASWGWRRDSVSNMSYHGQATHWMPLPAPPATPEASE